MKFSVELSRSAPVGSAAVSENRGGWFRMIGDWFTGAWQRDQEIHTDTILAHHAVWACITLIAQDVGKLRAKLVQRDENKIWEEVENTAFSPVLRRPNHFQNHIQFKEWWITSKLIRGNAYALIERDRRGVVVALFLLDPERVKVLVAPDGAVFYELQADHLSGLPEPNVTVPASEILHDRMNCLFHPLVGVSPIYACGAAANIGLKIQSNSASFFGNASTPGGILTTPASIDQATAVKIREEWKAKFTGDKTGGIAVLGNNMQFQQLRMTATDSQLIEQLKWSAETVCGTFHVPPFKIGLGQMPTYQNGELLNGIYYSDCLQALIEAYEAVMDAGLGLTDKKEGKMLGVELDLDALLRMDTATQVKTLAEGVKGGIYTPNEARHKIDLPPLEGGDTVYLQQQEHALHALARRDNSDDPFKSATPIAPSAPPLALPSGDEESETESRRHLGSLFRAHVSGIHLTKAAA